MTVAQIFGMDQSVISEANLELGMGGMLEGVCLGYAEECRVEFLALFSITVHTGILTVGGVFVAVSADEAVTVSVGAALPRYDRIIARRDNATNTVWIGAKEGTPAANPTPPSLTRSGGIYEISLARILIPAGGGVIDRNIVDERGEPSLCGYISFKAYQQVQRAAVEGWRQRGSWSAQAHGTLVGGAGIYSSLSQVAGVAPAQDADGIAVQQTTAAALNADAYVMSLYNLQRRSQSPMFECKFKLGAIAVERLAVGINSGGLFPGSDIPVTIGAALSYSTSRPDTNFMFVTGDGVSYTLVNSGVPADTAAHVLRILLDTNSVIFELMDTYRNIQSCVRMTTTLPGLTAPMIVGARLRTLEGVAKTIYQYYATGINRNI